MKNRNQPKYPIYIVSKGRSDSRLTAKALERMKVPYYMVVEEQEYNDYAAVVKSPNKVLILDKKFQDEYDTCDDLGDTKSKGPGAARNFCWDHAKSNGFKRHWVMDDNIIKFCRLNKNKLYESFSGAIFRAAEDFVDRYENIPIAGFQYFMFLVCNEKYKPFVKNTRIYSCLLIENNLELRWRGRYNEDTDLSLRVLKSGRCTIQFNAFVQDKLTTQVLGGGNTEAFYADEGTYNKSKMLEDLHPDCAYVTYRFSRIHHHVDYTRFKKIPLIKKKNLKIKKGIDNYGMIMDDRVTYAEKHNIKHKIKIK